MQASLLLARVCCPHGCVQRHLALAAASRCAVGQAVGSLRRPRCPSLPPCKRGGSRTHRAGRRRRSARAAARPCACPAAWATASQSHRRRHPRPASLLGLLGRAVCSGVGLDPAWASRRGAPCWRFELASNPGAPGVQRAVQAAPRRAARRGVHRWRDPLQRHTAAVTAAASPCGRCAHLEQLPQRTAGASGPADHARAGLLGGLALGPPGGWGLSGCGLKSPSLLPSATRGREANARSSGGRLAGRCALAFVQPCIGDAALRPARAQRIQPVPSAPGHASRGRAVYSLAAPPR